MTHTMIERVARAIDPSQFQQHESFVKYNIMAGDTEAEAKRMADISYPLDDPRFRARNAINEIARWHDEQAAAFKKMANDDRLSDEATAKAWGASKHHAGTAAAMRSILIGNRDAALQEGKESDR